MSSYQNLANRNDQLPHTFIAHPLPRRLPLDGRRVPISELYAGVGSKPAN